MNYKTENKRSSTFPWALILIILILILAAMSALSINKIRSGQPGFMTNLWQPSTVQSADAYLAGNPNALPVPNHVKTILLLGADTSAGGSYRTDVMLLAAFNTKTGKINLFSFPRDLWVTIPGWEDQRLNTAQPYGGYQLLGDTLAYNFGLRPDHYAMVDFGGFMYMIYMLDGIDVEVSQRMEDRCDFNAQQWCVVEPGTVHMDQAMALWYVRARLNSSDFDRTRRAQEVFQAVLKKLLQPASVRYWPGFFKAAQEAIDTDLKLDGLWAYALPLSKFFKDDVFTTYRLTPNEASPYTTDGGAAVLLPNYPAIQSILKQVLWIE